ncbi:hypothetical protein KP509_1Z051400 [Ceratopteris richardii]|nr:hypothetical protein KP509_1Z051400 [Ceratopteris richardii]
MLEVVVQVKSSNLHLPITCFLLVFFFLLSTLDLMSDSPTVIGLSLKKSFPAVNRRLEGSMNQENFKRKGFVQTALPLRSAGRRPLEAEMGKGPKTMGQRLNVEVQGGHQRARRMAGSTLPNCSHACGACAPCKLVTVNASCSRRLLRPQSQPCPLAYRSAVVTPLAVAALLVDLSSTCAMTASSDSLTTVETHFTAACSILIEHPVSLMFLQRPWQTDCSRAA